MATQKERAKQILSQYVNAPVVFFTSDNSPFVTELAAKNQAKHLEDKSIVIVTREEANAEEASEPAKVNSPKKKKGAEAGADAAPVVTE